MLESSLSDHCIKVFFLVGHNSGISDRAGILHQLSKLGVLVILFRV